MKSTIFSKTVSAGLLLSFSLQAQVKSDNHPNIIVILTDDMGWSDFGCVHE